MPVIANSDQLPEWCEMTFYQIICLHAGVTKLLGKRAAKEKLFVCGGRCRITSTDSRLEIKVGEFVDLNRPIAFEVTALSEATLVRLGGNWGDKIGGCGVFSLDKSKAPKNIGDPTEYARNTNFDNHYHDFDEYWIIVSGRGKVVTDNIFYEVQSGDCVVTGRGHHHDFPEVYDKIVGVYFETTLEGQGRLGHLWNHTHGLATPVQGRN